ncbi:MAG: hypothetical protein JOZ05_07885 [Acetobacteraceae bacterium]|nr:hypothetical protein [Acetobacteraceae bacterium]
MRKSEASPGYLAEVEASHLHTQAIPGAIVLHLRREIASEMQAGRPAKRMFIELTLGEAVQHWRAMGELIRRAGALERQSLHADAAPNL